MNVIFEPLTDVTGKMTITIEEKDYQDKVKAKLKELAKTHREPGFRPGHAPAALIQKKYGPSVKYDIVNREIGNKLFEYIRENKIPMLGSPIADKENVFKEDAPDFTFNFTIGFAPKFDDHVNKDLHIPYYNIKVSDEMVDKEVENNRKRLGKQVSGNEADADALLKGEIIELDENGNPKENGIIQENGVILPKYFLDEDQKKLFLGVHPGDTVKFNPAATCNANPTEMSSMLNIDKDDVENHKGDFNFVIKDIIVIEPAEMNQEFFDSVIGKDKAHNEEEFRKELKNLMELQLRNDSDYRFAMDSRDAITKAVGTIDLPEENLKELIMREEKEATPDSAEEQLKAMKPSLTWEIISDEIADRLGVKVTEEDLNNQAKAVVIRQLSQYAPQGLNDQIIERYATDLLKDEKSRSRIARMAMENKTFAAIKENVTLDEKDVTIPEFEALFKGAE